MYLFTTVLMYLLKLPRSFSLDLHTHAHPVWCFQQSHTDVGLGSHIQFCLKVSSSFLCLLYLMLGANPVKKSLLPHLKLLSNLPFCIFQIWQCETWKASIPVGIKQDHYILQWVKVPWYCKISWWRQAHR